VWGRQTLAGPSSPPAARCLFDLDAVITAEFDRVGVSLKKAELEDAVVAGALGDLVWIMGAVARQGGGRTWEGSEQQAIARLAELPDDAGAVAFWEAFSSP